MFPLLTAARSPGRWKFPYRWIPISLPLSPSSHLFCQLEMVDSGYREQSFGLQSQRGDQGALAFRHDLISSIWRWSKRLPWRLSSLIPCFLESFETCRTCFLPQSLTPLVDTSNKLFSQDQIQRSLTPSLTDSQIQPNQCTENPMPMYNFKIFLNTIHLDELYSVWWTLDNQTIKFSSRRKIVKRAKLWLEMKLRIEVELMLAGSLVWRKTELVWYTFFVSFLFRYKSVLLWRDEERREIVV